MTATREATPEIQEIADKVKPEVEEKTGKTYDTFQATEFSTQIVSGTNYFIKVKVGDDDYLHLRVYQNLQGELSLTSVQESKKEDDPIEYF